MVAARYLVVAMHGPCEHAAGELGAHHGLPAAVEHARAYIGAGGDRVVAVVDRDDGWTRLFQAESDSDGETGVLLVSDEVIPALIG